VPQSWQHVEQVSVPLHTPSPQTGCVVMVVLVAVVEVVVVAHPEAVQASRQLGKTPTHASPPRGAMQSIESRFTLQVVSPAALVRQQVTGSGFPHVDPAAHRTTAPLQLRGSSWAETRARV
jgi:hypothetical protein